MPLIIRGNTVQTWRIMDGTASQPSLNFKSAGQSGLYCAGGDSVGLSVSGTPKMVVDANGATVTDKLIVSGGPTANMGNAYAYLRFTSNELDTGTEGPSDVQVSVAAKNAVQASQCIALSDARVKDNIRPESNSSAIIDSVYTLPVTTWQYKDTLTRDARRRLGFIAQDIENTALGSYAVSTHPDIIPNIFRKAILTTEGYRIVSHGLRSGTLVRYHTPSTTKDACVTVVDSDTILFDPPEHEEGIFVYGTHAEDVRSLDYDAVTAALVLTIQDLNDRLRAVEKK